MGNVPLGVSKFKSKSVHISGETYEAPLPGEPRDAPFIERPRHRARVVQLPFRDDMIESPRRLPALPGRDRLRADGQQGPTEPCVRDFMPEGGPELGIGYPGVDRDHER